MTKNCRLYSKAFLKKLRQLPKNCRSPAKAVEFATLGVGETTVSQRF